jgi:hypothetical protein
MEDESILGYASLMPKINQKDGTIDVSRKTFLM